MKSIFIRIIIWTLGLGVVGLALGIAVAAFTSLKDNFDFVAALTDTISLACMGCGAAGGFILAISSKPKKKSSSVKTKGSTAGGKEYDLHYDAHFMTENEILAASKTGQLINSDWAGLTSLKKTGLVMRNFLDGSKYKVSMKDEVHTLVIGTTGSGKTSAVINPTIRILAHTAEKPCFVISDPKGELYDTHSEVLKKEGYNVVVYDLDNPFISARWNPMERAFYLYHRAQNIYKEAKKYSNCTPEYANKEKIPGENYGEVWYEFEGKAFPNEELLKTELASKKQQLINDALFDLRGIASSVCPVDPTTQDKSWEQGAQDFLLGVMLGMLEDSCDERLGDKKLRVDQFNFYNLYKIANKRDPSADAPFESLKRFCAGRPVISDVGSLTSPVINSAPITTRSYMSVMAGKITALMQDMGICYATSMTELNFRDFVKGPTAFFIKIPDHKKERHPLAVVCLTQLYRTLVDIANDMPGKTLPRHVYFILDEFGSSLPMIPDFATMVTVARSRKIAFEIVVQSYTQLDTKYGKDVSETLKGNFNATIFLGSEDASTKEAFSKSCGEIQLTFEEENESKNKSKTETSTTTSKSVQRSTRPLIDPFELGQLPFGTAIVTMFRLPPLKTKCTQYHKTPFMEKLPPKKIVAVAKSLDEKVVFYDITSRNEIIFGRQISRW